MTDDLQRRLADIEKRLARLEAIERNVHGMRKVPHMPWLEPEYAQAFKDAPEVQGRHVQWCDCGRDVCRAPDCPTHKKGGA